MSYSFVMNVQGLPDGGGSLEVAGGHELRRATADEITEIETQIGKLSGFLPHIACLPWRFEWLPTEHHILPKKAWRYFVIAFCGSNATSLELETVFDICDAELEIGFTIIQEGAPGALIWHPARLFHFLELLQPYQNESFWINLNRSQADEIRNAYDQVHTHNHQVFDLRPCFKQLRDLKALPRYSQLRFLGCFAVLESLLTHEPKPKDPYDSITRQITKKLGLLSHRCANPISYKDFGNTGLEKVWSTMYSYRSTIAHGGAPNFTKASCLKILKDQHAAFTLLSNTTKAVIRQVLIEPQLMADLRNC